MASRRAILGGILASPFAARQAAAEALHPANKHFLPGVMLEGGPSNWWGNTPAGKLLLRKQDVLNFRYNLARNAIAEMPSWSPAYRRIKLDELQQRFEGERSILNQMIEEFQERFRRGTE